LGNWEVTGTTNKSPGCLLSPATTAGQTFRLLRFENEIGNRMIERRREEIRDGSAKPVPGTAVSRKAWNLARKAAARRAGL